jgi:hypothetical protein
MSRRTMIVRWLATLLVATGVGVVAGHALWPGAPRAATPQVVRGTITGVSPDGRNIGFASSTRSDEGLSVDTTCWRNSKGEDSCGVPPTCLQTGTSGQHVELAIVDLGGPGPWPGRVAVWIHCLD